MSTQVGASPADAQKDGSRLVAQIERRQPRPPGRVRLACDSL